MVAAPVGEAPDVTRAVAGALALGLLVACGSSSREQSSSRHDSAGHAGSAGVPANAGGAPRGGSSAGGAGAGGVAGRSSDGGRAGDAVAGGSAVHCGSDLEQLVSGRCVAKVRDLPGGYAIDATEVTWGQYADWLSASPAPTATDADCSWNTSYVPDSACVAGLPALFQGDEYPMVCVDWCDARDYCLAVGKRLCGSLAGGPAALVKAVDANEDQWYRACSSGGVNVYGYGTEPDSSACATYDNQQVIDHGPWQLPVASLETCQSSVPGYEGVFDLSGNVYEWEDSCAAGADAFCLIRGAAAFGGASECAVNSRATRTQPASDWGFRCCSD